MVGKIGPEARLQWYIARQYHQFVKRLVDELPPGDDLEYAESELELAQRNLMDLDAPTLEGVCERIALLWGPMLDSADDPDMAGQRAIIENLRMLSAELDGRVSAQEEEDDGGGDESGSEGEHQACHDR